MAKRLILSNSFTIGQVRCFLSLMNALNAGKKHEKLMAKEEIGRVYQKFLFLKGKYEKAHGDWRAV